VAKKRFEKEIIQCKQNQWLSGACKNIFCKDCLDKEKCYKLEE